MVVGLGVVVVAQMMEAPTLGMVGLCIYIAAFAVSLGPLPYVLMTELIPSEIREQGIAVASATSWLFNALIALTFLSTVDIFGLSLTSAIHGGLHPLTFNLDSLRARNPGCQPRTD